MSETETSACAVESVSSDMLVGVRAISEFLNEPHRRTVHLLETARLPAFKIGWRWYMRKSTYMRFVENLEADAIARARKA